jgi:hypothetical protein
MDNYNYPAGADTSSAPWNQEEQESELIEVTISQTFSKTVEIEVDDYVEHKDSDEDGIYFWNDYSGCNLKEYVDEQHLTITDILQRIQDVFQKHSDVISSQKEPLSKEQARINYELRILAEAAKDWCEDEMEVVL